MMADSVEVQIARIDERTSAHASQDEETHGRLLGELGRVGIKLDTLSTRCTELAATLAPIVELYLSEHPSKVSTPRPLSKPPSAAKSWGIAAGAFIVFLEARDQVRGAILSLMSHH
jgi:hypothetical protein